MVLQYTETLILFCFACEKKGYFSKIAEILSTACRPKTCPNFKLCFIRIAHRATYIKGHCVANVQFCSIMAASFSLLYRMEFKFNDVLSIQIEGLVLPYSTNGLLLLQLKKIALIWVNKIDKFQAPYLDIWLIVVYGLLELVKGNLRHFCT